MASSQENASAAAHKARDDSETQKLIGELANYEFARLCFTDLNGAHLSKLVSCRKFAKKIAHGHSQTYTGVFAFGPRNQLVEWDNDMFRQTLNGRLVPDGVASLRRAGWAETPPSPSEAGLGREESGGRRRVCELVCNITWMSGVPVEAYPRVAVQRLLDTLDREFALQLYSAFEPEFFLFNERDGDATSIEPPYSRQFEYARLSPVLLGDDMYKTCRAARVQRYFEELDVHLERAGILVQDYCVENGKGQVEAPLIPSWGMQAADAFFTYKQAVKETAQRHGMRATFMTQPGHSASSVGTHYNFSVWRRASDTDTATPNTNAFQDESAGPDQHYMSETARHFIAGVLRHCAALCALFCPTTNCYRRLGHGFAPGHVTWRVDSRFCVLRVKSDEAGRGANLYMENRVPSGAVSPYLCMAAVLAAGLDGMRRRLAPPPPESRELGDLPGSLAEAVDRLQADEAMCELLGREMVEYFVAIKKRVDIAEVESQALSSSSWDEKQRLTLEHEKYLYFDYV